MTMTERSSIATGIEQADATVAAERERCAKIAETFFDNPPWAIHYRDAAAAIAHAIRAQEKA